MKEAYEILEMEVIGFDNINIITTSCPANMCPVFIPGENETEMGG